MHKTAFRLSEKQKGLLKFGIILVGITAESEETHLNFANKCSVGFPVLSDLNKKICRNYKAINLFGRIKRKLVLVVKTKKFYLKMRSCHSDTEHHRSLKHY